MSDAGSTAISRINRLLDPNSFVQLGEAMTARATDFNKAPKLAENDGVITGHGLIDGNLVFVYSQDPNTLGGTFGEMHAKKICMLYDMAMKVGAPVIGILDSRGIRLLESADAGEGLAALLAKMAQASGSVPMISAIFGQLGGGMAAIASVSDFTFMADGASLFVTPTDAVEGASKEKLDPSKPASQLKTSGVVDSIGSEDEVLGEIRELIMLVPGSALEEGRLEPGEDDMNRVLDASVKESDTETFVSALADNGRVFVAKPEYAPAIMTAIIKLGGRTVGVVANTRKDGKPGKICGKCASKAARFIRFLDAFEIPILTITDVAGFKSKLKCEQGLPLGLGDLVISLANATTSKINLIRSGVSSAYLFMNSKSLSADLVYSYPDAKLELMDAGFMAEAMAADAKEDKATIEARLKEEVFGAKNAARRGYVDSLLDFADTRKYLIAGFDMLYTKTALPYKKHESR